MCVQECYEVNRKQMFVIKGKHDGEEENIDEFETKEEAQKMLSEYKMAFGEGWAFKISRRN